MYDMAIKLTENAMWGLVKSRMTDGRSLYIEICIVTSTHAANATGGNISVSTPWRCVAPYGQLVATLKPQN